jgi:hypothetical protein
VILKDNLKKVEEILFTKKKMKMMWARKMAIKMRTYEPYRFSLKILTNDLDIKLFK